MYPFLKSWIEAKQSVNMSQLPDASVLGTPSHTHGPAHANDMSRKSDPGPSYPPAALNVVSGRMSPSNRNLKDYGTQISDLKKENFSLKLRIFYMEERMQERFDGDQEQLWCTNIELKVECDSLRKELHEKHDLLVKASNAVACMETTGPEEMRKARNDAEQEVLQLRELMNEKVENAEKELRAAQQDAEQTLQQALDLKKELEEVKSQNKDLLEALSGAREALENANKDPQEDSYPDAKLKQMFDHDENVEKLQTQLDQLNKELEEKDNTITQLKNSLSTKQTVVELLNDEKRTVIDQQVEPLMRDVEQLKQKLKDAGASLADAKRSEERAQNTYQDLLILQDDYQEHITEQQQRLDDFELATKQMSEELEKRETEVQDLKEALRETEETVEELTRQLEVHSTEIKDKHTKTTKDITKRDRAIAGLTQLVRKKDEEIETLQEEIRQRDAKTEELLNNIRKLELPKNSPTKDALLNQLREQLKESDTALQDALDEKFRSDDQHEKRVREFNQQTREKDRQLDRLKSQVSDYEETVASLDGRIREKDIELQNLATQHKNLLRDLQMKEDERLRAVRERDELLAQCEEEKRRFSELTGKMLRRSSGEFSSSSSLAEIDAFKRIRNLESDLLSKNQALKEATRSRDQALSDLDAARNELERALYARDEELDKSRRTIALRDVEIRQLQDSLRSKDELMHDLERELRFELDKLSRQNEDLRMKLKLYEEDLARLKSNSVQNNTPDANKKRRLFSSCSLLSLWSSQDGTESESHQREIKNLHDEVNHLHRQLDDKNTQLKELQRANSSLNRTTNIFDSDEEDTSTSDTGQQGDTNITYNYYNSFKRRPKSKRKPNHSRSSLPHNHATLQYDSVDMTTTDDSTREQGRFGFNRLRQVHAENRAGNMTIDTTFGFPLDQTSYMSMPDGYHGNSDEDDDLHNMTISELKQTLRNTRSQLSDAIREVADLRKSCNSQTENIRHLEEVIRDNTTHNEQLLKEYNIVNKERMAKESEVLGLLARIQDNDSRLSKSNHMNGFTDDITSEDDSVMGSARSRRLSGDESDGMSSLSRRELRGVICNLKKKLHNAEKVNELLKRQVHDNNESDGKEISTINPQLVIDLAAEVERLKERLKEQQIKHAIESEKQILLKKATGIPLLRSKLPIPVDSKGTHKVGEINLRAELERARLLNRKLNERLAATEQTVRQQADKLNKCRAALREAGIASPPVSPIRAARSVPNLLISPDISNIPGCVVHRGDVAAMRNGLDRSRSTSNDTNEASTQTSDSGIVIVSPKSEQRFNSLIQAQAKELSSLRQQLKKSRDSCRHLQTEMDVLSRYVSTLLTSAGDSFDPILASAVSEELERSRKLVAKMRKNLSDNAEEGTQSEGDSDSSVLATPLPTTHMDNEQVQRLANELDDKNDHIKDLEEKLENLQVNVRLLQDRNRLRPDSTYTADKWLSAPNLLPLSATTLSSQGRLSSDVFKKRPSSIGTDYHARHRHGLLTPTSSHQSLHSASEDEMMMTRDDSSHLPTRLGDIDDRYASLPSALDKIHTQHRSSWPIQHNQASPNASARKSMPMYQRTIAVTEYLPPNLKAGRDYNHRPSSGVDEIIEGNRQHRMPTASEAEQCSASYAGLWATNHLTPRKTEEKHLNTSKSKPSSSMTRVDFGESSCDDEAGHRNHQLAREVDRLRRRLTDSKRMNRSLKEELDLASKSLQRTKDSLIPGYQRTAHHNADVLAEHLSEIRGLRQRLEQTIATNDKLREKLEARLIATDDSSREHLSANIFVSAEDEKNLDPCEVADLKKRLVSAEEENAKLQERLKLEEKAHDTYEEAIKEMKSLQHHLVEKSSQTDLLTKHVDQLQQELEQQTSLSGRLGDELSSRNIELTQSKRQLEKAETDAKKILLEEEKAKDAASKMYKDVQNARGQLDECHQLIDSLKSEVALYEKLHKNKTKKGGYMSPAPDLDLSELLQEIRSLRIQLERSIDANAALRRQLEEQLKSPRKRDESALTTINIHHLSPRREQSSAKSTPHSARRKLKLGPYVADESVLMTPPASASSGGEEHAFHFDAEVALENGKGFNGHGTLAVTTPMNQSHIECEATKGRPYYSPGGPYTLCKTEDFDRLQQTLANGGLLARKTDDKIAQKMKTAYRNATPDKVAFKDLSKSLTTLCHYLDDSDQLLQLFWPAVMPYSSHDSTLGDGRSRSFSSSGVATGGHCSSSESPSSVRRPGSDSAGEFSVNSEADGLRREVGKLQRRLKTQDRLLQTTVERLQTTNKLKEGIEQAIVKQLSRTHDVLRQARGNLEAKVQDSEHRPQHAS